MAEWIASSLIVTTGLCAAGVGIASAASRIRTADRTYRRTVTRHAASGGWNLWFLDGFSRLTIGTQWLTALAAGSLWTLAGLGLVGLGVRLLTRA